MELNLRTVLVVLGGIVMLTILVDGFRRMRRARQEALKIDVQNDFQFSEESFSSELPNGGSRLVSKANENASYPEDDTDDIADFFANDVEESDPIESPTLSSVGSTVKASESVADSDQIRRTETPFDDKKPVVVGEIEEEAQQATTKQPLNLDEKVPLLMDVEDLSEDKQDVPVSSDLESKTDKFTHSDSQAEADHIELAMEDIASIEASIDEIKAIHEPIIEPPEASKTAIDASTYDDGRQQAEDSMVQAAHEPVKKPGIHAESLENRPAPGLVLVTHVVPHSPEGFAGEDILYLVNSCDLRFGEKGIFHRFENEGGEGCIQFSMAHSMNPGTFNPVTLSSERIHGLSLFMSLPGPKKAMDAFEAMSEMASVVARNLGGDVHDETHSIMALQTIEHNRQQVRDYVRKQKILDKK